MKTHRTCALPGCDEQILIIPGGHTRTYCTERHRVEARKQRVMRRDAEAANGLADKDRSGLLDVFHGEDDRDDRSDGAEPSRRAAFGVVSKVGSALGRPLAAMHLGDRVSGGRLRRGHILIAMLAVVAVAASGVVATDPSEPGSPPVERTPAGMSVIQPLPDGAEQWPKQAQQTLDAVNQELTLLTQAVDAWNKAAAGDPDPPPEPVQNMIDRRKQLTAARDTLSGDIANWTTWEQKTTELRKVDAKLANVEQRLNEGGDDVLRQERGELTGKRNDLVRELTTLHSSVVDALARDLPGTVDANALTEAVNAFIDALENPPAPAPTPEPEPPAEEPPPQPEQQVVLATPEDCAWALQADVIDWQLPPECLAMLPSEAVATSPPEWVNEQYVAAFLQAWQQLGTEGLAQTLGLPAEHVQQMVVLVSEWARQLGYR